ncbi:TetR/AcrR family transcriptional regulator [Streptomyces qinzhouensis]|uniref:TetR/AcrR family transcriptional regulator n=1 Tax=Streptomyces qinzhouensis TaxID=2599401 RepID=A0A5B8J2D0_9ACTN|nr:TetR/AcrR family transcriptional regulator [Streptomyces qinzhouensis]QDY75925.1 TetR/AcrR family transcriptional regulator [Streptomyces qinzhouensis]
MTVDREQVLRAAAALLSRKGSATMDEVARAAGIGRATLHRHFAGRDTLVRALEDYGLRELETAISAARLDEDSAADALRRLVAESERCAPLFAFLVTENQLFEGEDVHEGWQRADRRIVALVKRGQEEGVFRIDLTAVWIAEALFGLISSAAWAIQSGRIAARDYTFMITELLLGGVTRRSVEK